MNLPLRILLIEDSPTDAVLIQHELADGGLTSTITRVETEAEIRAELKKKPDLVMADYSLPGFTAMDVLDWYRQSGADVPFILVSGTIDTETAVASMRKGATDYILKKNLAALPGAVHRAMEAHDLRRAKTNAEKKVLFLAQMLDLAQDAVIVCDFDHSEIKYWNKGAQELYGWAAGEVMGRNIKEIIKHPEDETFAMIKSLLRSGEWSTEAYHTRRDGREIAVSERATLARDPAGAPSAVLFIHNDITERKLADEQIRYREALIRETGEIAGIGSWEINILTGKSYWTAEVARILHLPPNQVPSMELASSVFRGQHRRTIEEAFKAATEKATPYDEELELIAADGTKTWVRSVGHPIVEDGRVIRLCGIFQDVTRRHQVEEQLLSQARLLDLASDAIIVFDFKTGRIQYWNQGAERMHGWTAEEVIGEEAANLLLVDESFGPTIVGDAGQKGEWSGELLERTKDGREIMVNCRVTLVRDESGNPCSLLAIHADVTERKMLETQFLRAQRLESVGTLASGVAHDLNNILSPIVMAAPLLDGDLSPEKRKSIVQTINASARRGVEIVRQVLTFARGMEGVRVPVNCEKLIGEIATVAAETFPKTIAIQAKSKPGLWPALGDRTQLQQILLNLCINARDAMPGGGTLSVTARNFTVDHAFAAMTPSARIGPHVLFQVVDTGTGIPRDMIDKIFDPFFTTKEVGKGTGLGLSTVVGIVKSHGGFVNVESAVGRGTTFKVFIPAAPTATAVNIAEPDPTPLRGNGELVLLVDDEPPIRQVSEAVLQQAGYRVLLAADGTEAIARYVEHRAEIRVVITDVVMPFLDGVALTRALRNLDPKVKIIGTSGNSDSQLSDELRALGLQDFLTKPYDQYTVLASLHRLLHRYEA